MKKYAKVNNLMGLLVFIIASAVYCLTIEPTASYWDCPEFTLSAYKLEVGHPPGAPFFMLLANMFGQFASDVHGVAAMVNYMSALLSGACIMFLFWSITRLTRKLVWHPEKELTSGRLWVIMGSGLCGALAYTFSDTFWFSAVESEVYAFSSLFTAVVFWLILKWEDQADDPSSDRLLILIAYLVGLSIGVHLLNLLCLPAIVLVYYYRGTEQPTVKGSLLALGISVVLVGAVLYGIVPGIVKVGGWFELFMVNTLGLPFDSGLITYVLLLFVGLIWSIAETHRGAKSGIMLSLSVVLVFALSGIPFFMSGGAGVVVGVLLCALLLYYLLPRVQARLKPGLRVTLRGLNTGLLSVFMIVVGYSCYALIVVRSAANPSMDQNSPEDIFTLGEYLGRKQYGTRPLIYGPAYSSRPLLVHGGQGYCTYKQVEGEKRYVRKHKTSPEEKDSYVALPGTVELVYAQNMFLPRMYSPAHAASYKEWVDIKGHNVPYDECGEQQMVNIPTQWENFKFFVTYQLNYMYWRYFMWNFVGRQSDVMGNGAPDNGNWITGIGFIDRMLIGGDQSLLPTALKQNKGRNVYYGLPLLLGLIGLFWQVYHRRRGAEQFWVVFFLFFMTGIAIILYLNQKPMEPRERDYAFAASFYAFAIWIGMGVAAVAEFLRKRCKMKTTAAAAVATLIGVAIPLQMASQNWDDHDRSHRYFVRDFGQNYLNSMDEANNPIIYTNGDNDTFPLWYNQEVEGARTDTRVCNLQYLQTDWYIDQMRRPAYESPSLPISWSRGEYVEGKNDYVSIRPELKLQIDKMYQQAQGNQAMLEQLKKEFGENPYELKNILKNWVRSDKEELHVIPTDSIVVRIDYDKVRRSGMLMPDVPQEELPQYMTILLRDERGNSKRALYKNELMMLEMLATADWERPIYMATTVGSEMHLGLQNFFVQEGLASRITPFDTRKTGKNIDTEKMYDNLMNRFKFGGMNHPGVYIDENAMRMCEAHRRCFAQLAFALIKEGKKEKTLAVLQKAEKEIPHANIPYTYFNYALVMAECYYLLDKKEEGDRIASIVANNSIEYLTWYRSMTDYRLSLVSNSYMMHMSITNEAVTVMKKYSDKKQAEGYEKQLDAAYEEFLRRVKQPA